MMLRKTQLAAAVGAALLVGGTTAVQAQNLQVQLYGQVNRALMYADDEVRSKIFHVDGQPSSTRFGIMGTSQIAPGLRAGARIESEMKSNPSHEVSFATPSQGALAGDAVGFAERWLDASIEGAWGRIEMGQGSGAADDASTIDISGTSIANGWCICDWGGGIAIVNSAGAPVGATVGAVMDNMDFESRYDRVRYISPVLGGFRGQVGFGQRTSEGEAVEASLWYTAKIAGEIQAGIGWSNVNLSPTDRETIGGSVSWLHTSGFSVTFAYNKQDLPVAPARDATHMSGKVGYKFGTNAIAVGYTTVEDLALAGTEGKAYHVGYVWNPIRWAEFYANYINYTFDGSVGGVAINANDVKVAAIGTRIRF
jgi:predicted porin